MLAASVITGYVLAGMLFFSLVKVASRADQREARAASIYSNE